MQGEFGRLSNSSWKGIGSTTADPDGETGLNRDGVTTGATAQQQQQGGGWLHSFASTVSLLKYKPESKGP